MRAVILCLHARKRKTELDYYLPGVHVNIAFIKNHVLENADIALSAAPAKVW